MSQNPSTPPEYSSAEDTSPDNLLARLRKITGVTSPALVPEKARPRVEDGAPPVDRLIPVVRDCFAAFAAGGIATGVAVATGAVWLWGRSKEGVRRAMLAGRASLKQAQERRAAGRRVEAKPLDPEANATTEEQTLRLPGAPAPEIKSRIKSGPPAPLAVPEPPEILRGRVLKFFRKESGRGDAPEILTPVPAALPAHHPVEGTGRLIPGNVITLVPSIQVISVRELPAPVIVLPAPAILLTKPARRFRRVMVASVAVLLLMPCLWLVRPVRYYFTSLMGWGNAAVIVAREGWLFPRAESETGAAAPPLRETAASLREHGATLVVISVPAKSAVYPEKLSGSGGGVLQRQPPIAAALKELTESGAQVLDLGPVLHEMKRTDSAEGFLFSPQSAHWSPRGMAQAAYAAASFIQQQPGYAALPLQPSLAVMAPATGLATTEDLVTALDSPRLQSRYAAQTVPLIRLLSAGKKEPLTSDPASPVVLLGGENVRLYDDPALGHPARGLPDGQGSSAGFAQHLAWYLSTSMEVHAAGSGVTAAKEWLASRPEADRKAKRLIVWVLSDADLLR